MQMESLTTNSSVLISVYSTVCPFSAAMIDHFGCVMHDHVQPFLLVQCGRVYLWQKYLNFFLEELVQQAKSV